ncbi:MAG: hypothetical protein ACREM1_06690 [Longimicrobiales bacterium]
MKPIFTGPRRQASILARMLRAQHVEAVMMFTEAAGQGAVYVPDDTDAEDQRAIDRAIEASEIEYDAEGRNE